MATEKILLGLTTTPESDWREKINEINKYKIKEIALFPTYLEAKKRKELYALLENSCVEKIPHVHLRDDMESWEISYFYQKYQTRLFNVHPRKKDFELIKNSPEYHKNIFVENTFSIDRDFTDIVKLSEGICFDVSHFHSSAILMKEKSYRKLIDLFKTHKIGCCHISAILQKSYKVESYITKKMLTTYSSHYLYNLNEVDYVKEYLQYLPQTISIELENSFQEQIAIKKHLEKFLL